MSTLKTGALRGTSGTADSIQLHASNQSVTFPGAVTVTGALTSSTTGLGGLFDAYAIIEDQKSNDTHAGTFTQDAWRTRDLNTENFDPSNIVTISSNQFTLGAATYYIEWSAPAREVRFHQTRLYNITDSAVVRYGSSEYAMVGSDSHQTRSFGKTRVTITGSTAFEIQHYCSDTKNDSGFGVGSDLGGSTEHFTMVEIYREA